MYSVYGRIPESPGSNQIHIFTYNWSQCLILKCQNCGNTLIPWHAVQYRHNYYFLVRLLVATAWVPLLSALFRFDCCLFFEQLALFYGNKKASYEWGCWGLRWIYSQHAWFYPSISFRPPNTLLANTAWQKKWWFRFVPFDTKPAPLHYLPLSSASKVISEYNQ